VEPHVDTGRRRCGGQRSGGDTTQAPHGVHRGQDGPAGCILGTDSGDVLPDIDDGLYHAHDEQCEGEEGT